MSRKKVGEVNLSKQDDYEALSLYACFTEMEGCRKRSSLLEILVAVQLGFDLFELLLHFKQLLAKVFHLTTQTAILRFKFIPQGGSSWQFRLE